MQRKALIREFFNDTGWTDYTNEHGIRKDHRGNGTWDFYSPDRFLDEFLKWYDQKHGYCKNAI